MADPPFKGSQSSPTGEGGASCERQHSPDRGFRPSGQPPTLRGTCLTQLSSGAFSRAASVSQVLPFP